MTDTALEFTENDQIGRVVFQPGLGRINRLETLHLQAFGLGIAAEQFTGAGVVINKGNQR